MNTIKTFLLIGMIIFGHWAHGQDQLPPFVDFTGEDSDTLTWVDGQGVHLLLLEQSRAVWNEEEGTTSKSIQATHWLMKDGRHKKTWSFEDGIKDCPVDVEAKFLTAPRFTDLDKDGIYEVWLMVQKACKGDVSPSEVQVIMVDKENKTYCLEAEQLLVFQDKSRDGGAYDLKDFRQLPRAYQDYAVEYLLKNYRFEYD